MSKNGEPGSLKVPEKAICIINQYKNDEQINDLIFPELKRLDKWVKLREAINLAESRINSSIKKIMALIGSSKNASPHKFRHAFAQRAEEANVTQTCFKKCTGMN